MARAHRSAHLWPATRGRLAIVNTVVILVPRGNRKTSLSAALALLHTIGPERVPGGEVIFAASDRKQAGIAFKEARGIVQADPKHLVPATKVYDAFNSAKKIAYPRDGVELEVISSDAPISGRPHARFVLADEIHVWRGDWPLEGSDQRPRQDRQHACLSSRPRPGGARTTSPMR